MRITLESGYALRIVTALAKQNCVVDAKSLSNITFVSPKFTLKILNKLVKNKLVRSFKGSKGGYELNCPSDKISIKSVIEVIDGPILLSRCLEEEATCTLHHNKTDCIYHCIFDKISIEIAKELDGITIADVIEKEKMLK